ncbi:YhdH/YhfP family quinone oxidoreductase [Pedobacter sp. L105]|uniref:YhdH/YhfP family quinone oxidoreductase n=1 Tax=Pedobacter sp. L105 TaxID=1641871 RepID=UPI00131D5556|nr:YhdH/YhfP family quinone oxidoreductase [Pedobacter sp. L105]
METLFKALIVRENDGKFDLAVETISTPELPKNEVLIKVSYSSVNYKDALSASGNKGVTRKFPHIPGIDAVGTVVSSMVVQFQPGDDVLVTGYDLGMNTWGGFGGYISVPASWIAKLPENLSPLEAMSFGTAGLTAGLSVYHLINSNVKPDSGKIAVSGATGGVGSISVAVLSKLGYEVVAISGKDEPIFLTRTLGASSSISRQEFVEKYNTKPLSATEFAGGIDTVGGNILSAILKSSKYNGVVTCCGLVASTELSTSIFPFILRGVKLIGIDSVEQPVNIKQQIWNLLSEEWKPANLSELIEEISLEQLPETLKNIINGKAKGRYVVRHNH